MVQAEDIRQLIFQGDYRLTVHARKRMAERNISHRDIQKCAELGMISERSDGCYILIGKDIDDQTLKVICAYENDVLIITVF
ncbi:MAG: DUF4258 domain-containing protein [Pseudobdellovibrio sp.]